MVQGGRKATRRGAVAAALTMCLLSATACSFLAEEGQPRFEGDNDVYRYSAGDGVNISGVGPLSVRNVLVVANEEGTMGNLVAAIVNNTPDDHVLTIDVGDEPSPDLSIDVPAETTISYGDRDTLEDAPLIEDLSAIPGSTVAMTFQAGNSEPVTEQVPVLGDCLPYLDGLEPRSTDQCDDSEQ